MAQQQLTKPKTTAKKQKQMNLPQAIGEIRDSVFQVQVLNLSPVRIPQQINVGTAFAVDEDGLLVTAKHVVDGAQKIGGKLMVAFAGRRYISDTIKLPTSSRSGI